MSPPEDWMAGPRLGVGVALTLAGWLIPRLVAKAPIRLRPALALDIAPPLLFFVVFLAVTARPVFAGVLVFAMMGGFAFTDWVKRAILLEPVVFSDVGEAIELFRHPQLYLPFAGTGRVLAGAAFAFSAFVSLLILEPPALHWSIWTALLVPAVATLVCIILHGPKLGWTAETLRGLAPSGDPFRDASTLGPLAMQATYSLIARSERSHRRSVANQRATPRLVRPAGRRGPVMVVQCESFFDARRLHPGVGPEFLPNFERCSRAGVQWGRLTVPGWGANTMRAEFAVMTGLSEEAVGFDRFNPYFAFARAPLASLARRMQAEGYRTICLHPFDRTFYRRDHVMPCLGFDAFLGEEAFAGARRNGLYIDDTEVARVARDILHEEGDRLFLFAITMDNHGPWTAYEGPPLDGLGPLPQTSELPSLLQFLAGARRSDRMLGMMTEDLAAYPASLCAFYGDHLPSLPATFASCDFTDTSTDYLIWSPEFGPAVRQDLPAHALGDAIMVAHGAALTRAEPTRRAAGSAAEG